MKHFDKGLIKPTGGQIGATIFENKHINIPKTLFFNIQIELDSISIEHDTIKTEILLNFIKFKINRLKELENRAFDFPVNPTAGYIDGSIYLFEVHNPVDVTRIEFGTTTENAIEAKIHYTIDFEFEGTGYSKTEELQLTTILKFGSLSIDPDILGAEDCNIKKSKDLLIEFCDKNDYDQPKIMGHRIEFEMNVKK